MSNGFFNYSNNLNVSGGTFINQINSAQETPIENRRRYAVEHLRRFAAPSGLHDWGGSFDRPKCHENTRIAVLNLLNRWTLGERFRDLDKSILWLYGDAGAGKSAIAQTLAERCAKEKRLLGSFFFSKNYESRKSHISLVATIVYYAATTVEVLQDPIANAVRRDQRIFDKSLEDQLTALLINPIKELFESPSFIENSLPNVLIIDGLDECPDLAARCHILHIFSAAAQKSSLPLKILFASRPETDILSAFNSNPLSALSVRIALDATFRPNADIRLFLGSSFEKIKATHPLKLYIPPTWPGEDLDKLVEKSSGQFIYASVVAKYISSQRHKPVNRLDIVLGLMPMTSDRDLPFAELDALYHEVLSEIPTEHIEIVLTLLRCSIFIPGIPRYAYSGNTCMPRLSFLSLSPGDPELYLGALVSVLEWTVDSQGEIRQVKFSHASFREFLLDVRRSKRFHISRSAFFVEILEMSLGHLKECKDFFDVRDAIDLSLFVWEKVKLTPGILEQALDFSLLSIFLLHYPEMPRQDYFIWKVIKFISLLHNSLNSQTLYSHHLKGFDACMTFLLEKFKFSPDDNILLLITAVQGLNHPVLRSPFFFSRRTTLRNLFCPDVPGHMNSSHRVQPFNFIYDFAIGIGGPGVNDPAVDITSHYFCDPGRSGHYVLDGKRYAAAALACFKSLCEGNILQSVLISPIHCNVGVIVSNLEGLACACAYLPQLLQRSYLSNELADYIRTSSFVKIYSGKKIPEGFLCLNFNLEDLIPGVIQGSEAYLKLFDSRDMQLSIDSTHSRGSQAGWRD